MPKTTRAMLVAALLGLALDAHSPAAAMSWTGAGPEGRQEHHTRERATLVAQGSCSAAASQAAAQSGGQVLSVSVTQQGGRTICVVTVLVPGRDGDRPRRVTVSIPQ